VLVVAAVALALMCASPALARAADDSPAQQLANRYAPVVMLKAQSEPCDSSGEQFVPAPVSIVLGNPAVQLLRGPSKDQSGFELVAKAPTAGRLAGLGKTYYLDLPGDPLHAGCTYEQASRDLMQGKSPTTYAHVLGEPGVKGIALQYWFFWYFNQFNDVHEGDWEMIQIAWDGTSSVEDALARPPSRIALAQHGGGELASWSSSKLQREGDHPVIYPASGSHATYYADALYLGTGQNGSGFGCDDATAPSRRISVDAVVVPNGDVRTGPFAWLSYEGKWGQYEPALNNGPDGPAQHSQWREPFRWMDDLRSSSPEVPLGSSFGPSVTGVFCGVIAKGSILYNRLSRNPGVIYALVAGIVLLAVYLTRRTTWSPAPVVPLDQPRRTGQILTAAARVYGVRGRELLALGAVFVPLSLLAALLQQLIFENGFVDALGHATTSDAASAAIALIAGTASTAVAYTLVVALVSVVLRDELAGSRPGWRPAYSAVARRAWPLITTQLLVTISLVGLCLTLIGIPYALKKAVDWAFTPWQVVIEGRSGRDAMRASADLVRGDWKRTGTLTTVLVATTLVLGPAVGIVLIFTTGLPLSLINVVGSIAYALVVPYTATAIGLLLLELRRRHTTVDAPAPAAR